MNTPALGVYQAFRWWGIGTQLSLVATLMLVYQAFRWWGIGTDRCAKGITG